MKKSMRERLADAKKTQTPQVILRSLDDFTRLLLGGPELPTQNRFISSPSRVKAYMGPAGCAKTSTVCAAGWLRALFQPGCKGAVIRADYNDLMDTTALRMEEMLNRLPKGILMDRDKTPPMKWWIRPVGVQDQYGKEASDALGGDEPSQITFVQLKEEPIGVEYDWAIIDEANECEESHVRTLNLRLRYGGDRYPKALMLTLNPPMKTHWFYTAVTGRNHEERRLNDPWIELYLPQPNENQVNLPTGYYENLRSTLTEDQIRRFIDGQWGSSFEGMPVFRGCFKESTHVKDDLPFDAYSTLFRFWDFGYNHPVCIWAQVDFEGRLLVLHELLGSEETIDTFAARCKAVQAQRFPGFQARILDYGDPAVRQKKDTGSALAILRDAGINMLWTITSIEHGIKLMRRRFELMIRGEAAIQFHRRYCPVTIDGLRGGYRMQDDPDKGPKKDGFYDHSMDALRYGIVNLFGLGASSSGAYDLPENLGYATSGDPFYGITR